MKSDIANISIHTKILLIQNHLYKIDFTALFEYEKGMEYIKKIFIKIHVCVDYNASL